MYRLTLPQIAAYGRYLEEKAEMVEKASEGKGSRKGSGGSSVDSVDQLVAMFGDEDSKRRWADGRSNGTGR